ncbi:MAG TPA: SAM-dependent chlorinase/fluorinase [Terriglobales bacterium]|nr:SAM-dependent chlorinase/fluorinase [Terriglobales bacterium]
MSAPLITLASDFGGGSAYIAMLKGALLTRCPTARLVDLSHELDGEDIFPAALLWLRVYSYYPAGTIHLLALDRGGGPDRVLAAAAAGQFWLAMDEGGLGLILEQHPEAQVRAVPLPVRGSFVARDQMAPLAAAMAASGMLPGHPVADWSALSLPVLTPQPDGGVMAEVIHVDRFGNLLLNARKAGYRQAEVNGTVITRSDGHFGTAAAGALLLRAGPEGFMEIALAQGSAASRLNARRGTKVGLR